MKLTRRICKRGRVEIIPMIDTILILLIFYMSFSTFSEKEKRLDANLLKRSSKGLPPGQPPPPEIIIHVKNTGIAVNGNIFDSQGLLDALLMFGRSFPEAGVVIEADRDTKYQACIDAMDSCAQAHLSKVTFRPVENL